MNAVIDEDLPRSLSITLTELGFTVFDIRDQELRGSSDEQIFNFAQRKKAVFFSADLGFSNILDFPLGTHYGICILRFPNELPVRKINQQVNSLLVKLSSIDYLENLIIVSPGKLRIRRHKS